MIEEHAIEKGSSFPNIGHDLIGKTVIAMNC